MALRTHVQQLAQAEARLQQARLDAKAARFELKKMSRVAKVKARDDITRAVGTALARRPAIDLGDIWEDLMGGCQDDEIKLLRAFALFDLVVNSIDDGMPKGWGLAQADASALMTDETIALFAEEV